MISKPQLALPRVTNGWVSVLLPRPAAFAQFPALARHGLDLPVEAVVADGLILVEGQPQIAALIIVWPKTQRKRENGCNFSL